MAPKVPNPKFSFLSAGEIEELGLGEAYAAQVREAERDREALAAERREAARAREKEKRID